MAEASNKEESTTEILKDKTEDNEDATETTKTQQSQPKIEEEEELECAVCLQKCVHPVRLPCSHIFCFLCVKGVANQSKRCAMCRQEIPADFLDHPTLLSAIEMEKEEIHPGGYQWFYEGRNGWWQYDERTSHELEAAYGSGQRACEVLVAGFLYIIDFDRMVQLRRNDPSRRRRIKRDLSSIPKKGVAGIKLPSQLEAELSALHSAAHAIHVPNSGDSSLSHEFGDGHLMGPSANNNDLCPPTPTAPSNTPQTPHTPSATSSSSGSPDTSEPTHIHALSTDSHRHHYHIPHHHHHLHFHHPVHIPHFLAHNLTSSADHSILSHTVHSHQPPHHHHNQVQQRHLSHHPIPELSPTGSDVNETHPANQSRSVHTPPPPPPPPDLEEAVYQMDQLSLSADIPEYYPLDAAEVSTTEETEQYHLNLSSEDEQL